MCSKRLSAAARRISNSGAGSGRYAERSPRRVLEIDEDGTINKFREKSDSDGGVINAGFMVLNPEIFDYIEGDSTVFEKQPLETVAAEGQLKAYMHHGFWKCMDTQRDREKLEEMIASGEAPWMVW